MLKNRLQRSERNNPTLTGKLQTVIENREIGIIVIQRFYLTKLTRLDVLDDDSSHMPPIFGISTIDLVDQISLEQVGFSKAGH